MKGYIYKIQNIINGKCYIGSTINIDERKKYHFWQLKNNRHHSIVLQRAYNKYGIDNFLFSIIKKVDYKNILSEEQELIDLKGEYNSTNVAGLPPEYKVSVVIYNNKCEMLGYFDCIRAANKILGKKMSGHGKYPYYSDGLFVFKSNACDNEIKEHINTRHDKWHKKRCVYQFTKKGIFIKKWDDMRDASLFYSNKKLNNNIIQSINNKGTAYNYIWSYTSTPHKTVRNKNKNSKSLLVYKNGLLINKFESINEACRSLNLSKNTVRRNLINKTTTRYGYEFK